MEKIKKIGLPQQEKEEVENDVGDFGLLNICQTYSLSLICFSDSSYVGLSSWCHVWHFKYQVESFVALIL